MCFTMKIAPRVSIGINPLLRIVGSFRSLSDAPQIPVDSSGIKFGWALNQIAILGDSLFQWNRTIPELRPEWTGMESGGM